VHLFDPSFSNKVKVFQEAVVEWYRSHGDKGLPWRATSDPWAVLIAAFLLRKTTTGQVVRVYEELLKRYPSPRALLSASEDEVKKVIQPLGIEHQRARHLKELAEHVEKRFGGKIPCSKDELKKLPGVGDYTASEVLLAACGRPEPLLDRNMIRVLERVFSARSARSRPHTDPQLWAFAKSLVPRDPELARELDYGVLDLARKVCTARNPRCAECPLTSICDYYSKLKTSPNAP